MDFLALKTQVTQDLIGIKYFQKLQKYSKRFHEEIIKKKAVYELILKNYPFKINSDNF